MASTLGRASPFRRVPPSRAHTHLDSSLVEHQPQKLSVAGSNPAPTHNALRSLGHANFFRAQPDKPHTLNEEVAGSNPAEGPVPS